MKQAGNQYIACNHQNKKEIIVESNSDRWKRYIRIDQSANVNHLLHQPHTIFSLAYNESTLVADDVVKLLNKINQ